MAVETMKQFSYKEGDLTLDFKLFTERPTHAKSFIKMLAQAQKEVEEAFGFTAEAPVPSDA